MKFNTNPAAPQVNAGVDTNTTPEINVALDTKVNKEQESIMTRAQNVQQGLKYRLVPFDDIELITSKEQEKTMLLPFDVQEKMMISADVLLDKIFVLFEQAGYQVQSDYKKELINSVRLIFIILVNQDPGIDINLCIKSISSDLVEFEKMITDENVLQEFRILKEQLIKTISPPETMFNWSSVDRGNGFVFDEITKNLWAAFKNGRQVSVVSTYGLPQSGYRGVIQQRCACGVPFTRGFGYEVAGVSGNKYLIDTIAIHNLSYHRNKINNKEKAMLADLPPCTIPCDEETLKNRLMHSYDID